MRGKAEQTTLSVCFVHFFHEIMPPNHVNDYFSMSRGVQEESTQTEGSATLTSAYSDQDGTAENSMDEQTEGVIERLSRLFSTVS